MWDPKTGSVHETLDVIWLRQMYYKPDPDHIPINIAPTNNAPIPPAKAEEGEENADPIVEVEEGQEDEPAEKFDDKNDNDNNNNQDNQTSKSRSGCAIRILQQYCEDLGAATLSSTERAYYN
jgi:hypothetical protein